VFSTKAMSEIIGTKNRMIIRSIIIGIIIVIGIAPSFIYGQSDSVKISVTSLNDHIYQFTNPTKYPVNQYASVGADGILLVDDGYSYSAPKLKETLHNLGNGKIKLVINTHGHTDHIEGNKFFRDEAIIIAQRNTANRLDNRYYFLPPTDMMNRASLIFDDSLTLWFNGEEVRIIHVKKAHTDGDVIVHFVGSHIVCTGDLFIPDKFASIHVAWGGTVAGSAEVLQFLINSFPSDTKFVGGHNQIYSRDDLVTYHGMIVQTRDAIKQRIASGKSLEDLKRDSVLAPWQKWSDPDAGLGDGYWLGILYNELNQTDGAMALSLSEPITEAIVKEGIGAAIEKYHYLKSTDATHYIFNENALNYLGYNLAWHNMIPEAVAIFKLNTEEYPKSANVFDSYGEVLLVAGDTTLAIKNYKMSLKLNPKNTNAVDVLKKLGVK
jgi:cyclase